MTPPSPDQPRFPENAPSTEGAPSEGAPSDGALVAAVLEGDTDQFGVLFGRYQSALFRVAHSRLGSLEGAEDAVQETFYCAFKSLHAYNSAYSFRTWLWTILLNQCRRQYQKRRRLPSVTPWSDITGAIHSPSTSGSRPGGATVDDRRNTGDRFAADSLTDRESSPPDSLLRKERSELLEQHLSRLPPVQADALRLRFFGGLKFHEIAAAMECSLTTAKNRVRWGLTRMSQMLADAESTETGKQP